MKIVTTIAEIKQILAFHRKTLPTIGLVPTMGYLHQGHINLIQEAKQQNDLVVVTIFVNPLQFGPEEDFEQYPRDSEHDEQLLIKEGVDYLFAPSAQEMYPEPMLTQVEVPTLSNTLLGQERPGHFRGVTTVVAKLFGIIQPTRAYFGEKDFQQLTIIRRMVRDLSMPVNITGVQTVRETDGLACSSRNVYLTEKQRKVAPRLYQAIQLGVKAIDDGVLNHHEVQKRITDALDQNFAGDLTLNHYRVDICKADDLSPYGEQLSGNYVILLSALLGKVKLIDQYCGTVPTKQNLP